MSDVGQRSRILRARNTVGLRSNHGRRPRRRALSHKARLVKSLAADAIEDGANAARRAVKSVRRGVRRLEDVKDEGIYYVKRRPLKTIAMTAGVGFTAGLVAGWVAGRLARRAAS